MLSAITRFALTLLLLAGFQVAPAAATPSSPQAAVDELLAADRQFSNAGAGQNISDAIAAMLDDDVYAAVPPGVYAKGKSAVVASLMANPANANATASWAPVGGGIAADGMQGYTYGFMIIHVPDQPDRRAKYLSYWIKRAAGWRVIAYKRAASPDGTINTALRAAVLPDHLLPVRPSDALSDKYRNDLEAREKAFSDRAQVAGLSQAFLEFGSAQAVNHAGGPDFVYGNEAIAAGLPTDIPSPVFWSADQRVIVSSTGDMGVTYGTIRFPNSLTTIPFFTIWRRAKQNGQWLYVAEI